MVSAKSVRTAVGIVGNVISCGLFLSPLPTFCRIVKKKSVEDFSPIPYIATVLNCLCWIFYGMPFVHPDSLLVVTINGIGLLLELVYLALYVWNAPAQGRKKVAFGIGGEVIFFVVLVLGVLLGTSNITKRSLAVGIVCDVFNIIMYFSPLTVMKQVITTKSVEYMPFSLSLANFLNGSCWTAYALIYKFDIYILISNGFGALSGAVQLILYACYYSSTPKHSDEKPEVQLSTNPEYKV